LKVAVIIPAYNEERTIGDVVRVSTATAIVDEVIVVSDGSTDSTASVARAHGARVIELRENRGKGAAMKVGVDNSSADIIVFLDADLLGLEPRHIESMVQPVVSGEAEMSVGIFGHGRFMTDFGQIVAPYLSGQRAVEKDVLEDLPDLEVARFGVELALNRHIKTSGIKVKEVTLDKVTHLMKEEKLGFWRGLRARLKMYWEIIRYLQKRRM